MVVLEEFLFLCSLQFWQRQKMFLQESRRYINIYIYTYIHILISENEHCYRNCEQCLKWAAGPCQSGGFWDSESGAETFVAACVRSTISVLRVWNQPSAEKVCFSVNGIKFFLHGGFKHRMSQTQSQKRTDKLINSRGAAIPQPQSLSLSLLFTKRRKNYFSRS